MEKALERQTANISVQQLIAVILQAVFFLPKLSMTIFPTVNFTFRQLCFSSRTGLAAASLSPSLRRIHRASYSKVLTWFCHNAFLFTDITAIGINLKIECVDIALKS